MALAMGIASISAAGQQARLSGCKAELGAVYGADARIKLRSFSKGRSAKMKLKAVPPEVGCLAVSCWPEDHGGARLETVMGSPLIPEPTTRDKVSLCE
jgi:hypothetical protein